MPKKKHRFEWDWANTLHLWESHKVRPFEAEETLKDTYALKVPDLTHSQVEMREVVIGKTKRNRLLFLVFTIREGHIRVLHGRDANRREMIMYEERVKAA